MQLQVDRRAFTTTAFLVVVNVIILALSKWLEDALNLREIPLKSKDSLETTPISFILFAVVFAPLLEELAFRYLLKKGKYFLVIFTLSTFYFLIVGETIPLLISLLLLNILIGLVYLLSKKRRIVPIGVMAYSIIVFGWMHSINFDATELSSLRFIEALFLFFPYVLLGTNITYIRLRFGFFYGLVGHTLYNGILIFLQILTT